MVKNKNKQSSQNKKNYFYLIVFFISVLLIVFSWIFREAKTIWLTDILPIFHQTASKRLVSQGLSIFAFAFFLHSVLQSQAFQAFFASRRQWLEKRKYLTITLITLGVAVLSTNLSWFDEFVHFYPLVVPLLLSMGFDTISSLLCLYGGSIAGLMGLVSSERMRTHFIDSFSSIKGKIDYNSGLAGISFRLIALLLFTSLVVLFNIWYCSRNKNINDREIKITATSPPFTRRRKIVLALVGFFLGISILGQCLPVRFTEGVNQNLPKQISGRYEEKVYEDQGNVGKNNIAKIQIKNTSYWEEFGKWEERSLDSWLILGGIIICLITKQGIIKNLINAAQSSIPLLLIYIFSALPAAILERSNLGKLLTESILSERVISGAKYWALIPIFLLAVFLGFLISSPSMAVVLVSALATALKAFSPTILIYAAIFAWLGVIVGMSFSSNNGILQASLEKNQLSYSPFIRKVWPLWLMLFIAAFGSVVGWTVFVIK